MSQDANPALKICAGGCHCGNVRFEVLLPNEIVVESCNCSICFKTGNAHIIVPTSRFSLKAGTSALTEYRFNTGVAQHLFCSNCGVTSFYIPRSNPDGVAVTHACLDICLTARIGKPMQAHWLHDRSRIRRYQDCLPSLYFR